MVDKNSPSEKLSPWWRRSVIIVLVIGFAVLIWMAVRAHHDAPPIPEKVVSPSGETLFTREEILSGQEVFLKYGLMENGTIWGHGAYLGPDFSADYLHTLAVDARNHLAKQYYQRQWANLSPAEQAAIEGEVRQLLKQNRYNPQTHTLIFTPPEVIVLSKSSGKVDGLPVSACIKPRLAGQAYQGSKRGRAIDRFLCLDGLGFRGESPRPNILLHK